MGKLWPHGDEVITCAHDLIHQQQLGGDNGGALQDLLFYQVVVEYAGKGGVACLPRVHIQPHHIPRFVLLLYNNSPVKLF